jgi:hypothetical protein
MNPIYNLGTSIAASGVKKFANYLRGPQPQQNVSSKLPMQSNIPAGQTNTKTGKSVVAGSAAATPSVAPTIAPAMKSPAAQNYISQVYQPSQIQPLSAQNNFTTPSGAVVNAQGGTIQQPKVDPNEAYRAAFDQYISSLRPSDTESQASKYLSDLTLQSKKDYETALNKGDTLGFAAGEAARVNKNNAFQIEAASNALNALTGNRQSLNEAQRARLDFEKSLLNEATEKARYESELQAKQNQPFELSEGQARYEFDPATGGYRQIAAKGKTYAPSSSGGGVGGGSSSSLPQLGLSREAQNIIDQINVTGGTVDDFIKGNNIASQNLRNEVYAGLNQQGGLSNKAVEILADGKSVVDSLLNSGAYKALGGYSTRLGGQFTTNYGDAKAQAAQLQSILARDNLGLLKGAMSDKDLAFIQSMSSGFEGEGVQSEGFIKKRLEEIQTKLNKKIPTQFKNESAQPQTMRLQDGTILTLQADGTYE